jgi:lysophospholipase L1-like esterase
LESTPWGGQIQDLREEAMLLANLGKRGVVDLPLLLSVVTLRLGTDARRAKDAKVRIVALGDPITRGVRPGVAAEEIFAALLQAELQQQKVEAEVVNAGVGGERTDQALKRLDQAVLALKPRVVLVMYGTNDSYVDAGQKEPCLSVEQYRANLKELIEALRKGGAEVVLMTPPRWGEKAPKNGAGEHPNVRLEQYAEACRAVAREMKAPLVDHFAHWTKAAADGTDLGDWTTDQCHPNPRGHREITGLLLPTVLELLRKGCRIDGVGLSGSGQAEAGGSRASNPVRTAPVDGQVACCPAAVRVRCRRTSAACSSLSRLSCSSPLPGPPA